MTKVANPATRLHLNDIHPPFDSQLLRFFAEKLEGIKMIKQQRKTYTKPVLNAEAFVPDTYVAVCPPVNGKTEYWLACTGESDDGRNHSEDGCKRPTAYVISVDDKGYIQSIYEKENNSGFWNGGNATNITVNGSSASSTPLTDINGTYYLTWNTQVWAVTMKHTGTLKLSTAINVNLS